MVGQVGVLVVAMAMVTVTVAAVTTSRCRRCMPGD
jgi:hypothetical protein